MPDHITDVERFVVEQQHAVEAERKRAVDIVLAEARYHRDIGRVLFAGILFGLARQIEEGKAT